MFSHFNSRARSFSLLGYVDCHGIGDGKEEKGEALAWQLLIFRSHHQLGVSSASPSGPVNAVFFFSFSRGIWGKVLGNPTHLAQQSSGAETSAQLKLPPSRSTARNWPAGDTTPYHDNRFG